MIKKILHTRTFKVTVFIFICAVIYLSPGFSWNVKSARIEAENHIEQQYKFKPKYISGGYSSSLDASHYLLDFVDEKNILIGVTVWTSGLGGPGVLKAYGTGKTEIKQVKEDNLEKTLEIIERLNQAGLNLNYSDNTYQSIWHKAGLNCVLNTYCTLIDCNINQYGSYEKHLELTRAILDEVTAVGRAEGIDVKQEIIEKNIENCFDPKTAGLHYPSLYQDMKNGRLTEIDYLNGEVSRLGKIHNIPTPVCDVITLMIHSKESVNGNK